jgi:hypothetical protein
MSCIFFNILPEEARRSSVHAVLQLLEEPIVLGMRADPEPDDHIAVTLTECAIVHPNTY